MKDLFITIFNIIEIGLFISLIVKFLFMKNKRISSAGIGFFSFVILTIAYKSISLIFDRNFFELILFITSLIYLQIYFYECSKFRNLYKTITEINNIYKIQKITKYNVYAFSAFLFMLESLSVSIYSNSAAKFYHYDFIPLISVIVCLIYQICFLRLTKKYFLKPFILFTISLAVFSLYNIYLNYFILFPTILHGILGVFIRALQTFIIGYIVFNSKKFFEDFLW